MKTKWEEDEDSSRFKALPPILIISILAQFYTQSITQVQILLAIKGILYMGFSC